MLLRRLLLVFAVLLITSAIASSLAPRDLRRQPPEGGVPAPAREQPAAAPAPGRAPVAGELPADRVVRARVGDLVRVTVSAQAPDTVEIEGYDRAEPVDAATPARFEFVASREGRFRVTLRRAAREVGRLEVSPSA